MTRWRRIWEAFWFLPAVFCLLALILAEVMITVDASIDASQLGPLASVVNEVGAAGSRDLLGAIAGSTLTVAATSFTITIAVLGTASSTYGPRLVRNFMTDRGNQIVLGVFAATFLYSLMVLRSIRGTGATTEPFVPHLAVNLAILGSVLSVGVLVYFINHIADSVQVWTLAKRVRAEFLDAVDRMYPEHVGRGSNEVEKHGEPDASDLIAAEGIPVLSHDVGYLQHVAEERLLAVAERHDVIVALQVRPGDYVIDGTTLALVWSRARGNERVANAIRGCLTTERARIPHEDVRFALRVLEEMAVRALSPSMNDPYTALNALDELSAGLVRLAGRTPPLPYRYDELGRLRVIIDRVELNDLLDSVFDAMRTYAIEHFTVLRRTLELAGQVGAASGAMPVRANLRRHVDLIVEAYARTSPQGRDLVRLQDVADEVKVSFSADRRAA